MHITPKFASIFSKLFRITLVWGIIFSFIRLFEFSLIDAGYFVVYSIAMAVGYLGLITLFILSIIYWRKNRKIVSWPYIPFLLSILLIVCGLMKSFLPMHSIYGYQNANGLIYQWHTPGHIDGKVPAIVCFGGSEGGIYGANIM